MILYAFKKEDGDFKEILADHIVKKYASTKMKFSEHLLLGFSDDMPIKNQGYLLLKFGECIVNITDRDYSPIPNRDYLPKRNKR